MLITMFKYDSDGIWSLCRAQKEES